MLSGALAGLIVFASLIPFMMQINRGEDASWLRQVQTTAVAVAELERARVPLEDVGGLDIDGVVILDPADPRQIVRTLGRPPALAEDASWCPEGVDNPRFVRVGTDRWAAACVARGQTHVVAVRRAGQGTGSYLGYLVLALAIMGGVTTALGVLQLLSPLSQLSRAIEQLGSGDRGVRAQPTGIAELDDLIDRVNAAARAMEDREDAILSRSTVVQELARMVAHEVRNPLQSLELLSALIASEDDRGERDELARAIQGEIRLLDAVVQRLLRDSAGHGALTLHRTASSVAALVDKVLAFRRFEALSRGIRLERGPVDDVVLRLDRPLMSRALENLVVNALAVVPEDTGRIRVSAVVEDSTLHLRVDDNGPGVREDLADDLFQPGVTGRDDGTGLGLALVQGVIQAHDGYVSHAPSDLGGACFHAALPFESPPGPDAPPAADATPDDGEPRADPGGR